VIEPNDRLRRGTGVVGDNAIAPIAVSADTAAMQKRRGLTDQIRAEVLRAKARLGLSRYAIAKRLNTSEGSLHGFVTGRFGISSKLLDRLAELLGLRVVVEARPRPTKRANAKKGT
jgi:ribosome-binding protein aMBF1 (putative translation factor)